MSIDTRVHQNGGDNAPEGREPDARRNVPTQTSFSNQLPQEAEGDALPLDGSLTLNDTEPQDGTRIPHSSDRILTGSEAGGTAHAATESAEAADIAVDQADIEKVPHTIDADKDIGRVATGGI